MNKHNEDDKHADEVCGRDSLLRDFFSFLAKPDYDGQSIRKKLPGKLRDTFRLWSFGIVVAGGLSLLASFFIDKAGYDPSQNTVIDLFFSQPFYVVILMVFVWAPVTEELTFRLGLKYSPYRLSFTAGFVIIVVASFLAESIPEIREWVVGALSGLSTVGRLAAYLGIVTVIGILLGRWWSYKLPHKRISRFYRKHFALLFYLSSVVFGLVHIFNYYNLDQFWYLFPLLVIPQTIFGIIFAYIRVYYGLIWAIFSHFIHNAAVSMPILVYSFFPQPVFEKLAAGNPAALENLSQAQSMTITLFSLSMLVLAVAVLGSFAGMLLEYLRERKRVKAC